DVADRVERVEIAQRVALHAEWEPAPRIIRHIQPRGRQHAGSIKESCTRRSSGGESEETAARKGEGHGEAPGCEMVRSFYAAGLAMRVGMPPDRRGGMDFRGPK